MAKDPHEDQRVELHRRVERDMTLHSPTPDQGERMSSLRAHAIALAHDFIDQAPPSRELSLALTELDSSLRWAIAAIAREET